MIIFIPPSVLLQCASTWRFFDFHLIMLELKGKRKIASTLTFLGGCFAATDI